MYVKVNSGEPLDFGETAKTTTRRRFLAAISSLFHYDNVYTCVDPGIFVGFGEGGPCPNDRKKRSDIFLLLHLL